MFLLNVMISFKGCDGIELLDWLFDQNNGILRLEETGHGGTRHPWPIQDPNVCETVGSLMSLIRATNKCLPLFYCVASVGVCLFLRDYLVSQSVVILETE